MEEDKTGNVFEKQKLLFNRREILELLPHGNEFCFLDGITFLDHERWEAKGFSLVKPGYFAGHFKKILLCPKVIKEEAIAQLGAFLLLSNKKYNNYIPAFEGEYYGKDMEMVFPGDQLDLEIKMIEFDGRRRGRVVGRASVGGNLVHELTFHFLLMKEDVFERLIMKKIQGREVREVVYPLNFNTEEKTYV